jgi:hypothetical protein
MILPGKEIENISIDTQFIKEKVIFDYQKRHELRFLSESEKRKACTFSWRSTRRKITNIKINPPPLAKYVINGGEFF